MMRGLKIVSGAMGCSALTLSVLYLGPPSLVRRDGIGPQSTLVQVIDDIAPIFPLLFLIAGGLVLTSTLRTRGVVIAHGVAAGVWMFYGLLLLLGSIFLEPPAPVLTGTISIWAAVMHWGMSRAWADRGVR
ncbi:hypothetical protein [Rhodococcus pyridinivorans]|uniref:Integral membrane protein n=1 Tax=Rhodococcus pyridinivorans AK37 TaxID=1114960 RepID=H0JL40_9NOCA|nr:hypothetical protein [Rhodococcus pyridinivorans]EHK86375.1 hypothetical protein AK37_01467 [Rhodococcus pyridinivorans AK37]MCD2139535.1 hypothetical protein [Rhodococcus pyridinivorans]